MRRVLKVTHFTIASSLSSCYRYASSTLLTSRTRSNIYKQHRIVYIVEYFLLLTLTLKGKRCVHTSVPERTLTSMPRLSTPIKFALCKKGGCYIRCMPKTDRYIKYEKFQMGYCVSRMFDFTYDFTSH